MLVIADTLYFGNGYYYHGVSSVPITGGAFTERSTTLAGLQAYGAFATDGLSLYIVGTVYSTKSVWRFPLDFSGHTELAYGVGSSPQLLLLDERSVYYADGTTGVLRKQAK